MDDALQAIEGYLSASEALLGVRLTIVDHHGVLHPRGDTTLDWRWQSHRTEPVCDSGFGPRCIAHCRWQVNHRLANRPVAFVTRCWKGVREIAVPLRWDHHHLGTLYAGQWRQISQPRAAAGLPAAWQPAWDALPPWPPANAEHLQSLLTVVAEGLAQCLARWLTRSSPANDPPTAIATWLRCHAHLPITLGDLAEYLGKSPSRTGAIVRESFGKPFALLLREYRVGAAKHLLRTSQLSIAEIADAIGYDDPLYFSRCFRAETGLSPRAWRHQSRPAARSLASPYPPS